MLDSFLLYAGLITAFAGALSMIRPLPALRIRSWRAGAIATGCGLAMAAVACALPVRTTRVSAAVSGLDAWMPAWQFVETHRIDVAAPPERVYAAIKSVTAGEITFFRTLTAIRRGGRRGPESILNAPESRPLLEVATATSFIELVDDPPREIVIGTIVAAPRENGPSGALSADLFRRAIPPGFALAAMNFSVIPDGGGGSHVSTETRVYASDSTAARRFAVYWRVIHPGSDIIRRAWLQAVKRRAEAGRRGSGTL